MIRRRWMRASLLALSTAGCFHQVVQTGRPAEHDGDRQAVGSNLDLRVGCRRTDRDATAVPVGCGGGDDRDEFHERSCLRGDVGDFHAATRARSRARGRNGDHFRAAPRNSHSVGCPPRASSALVNRGGRAIERDARTRHSSASNLTASEAAPCDVYPCVGRRRGVVRRMLSRHGDHRRAGQARRTVEKEWQHSFVFGFVPPAELAANPPARRVWRRSKPSAAS